MSESKTPIDMVLYCPKCGMQHIDAPEEPVFHDYCTTPEFPAWDNPPHKSHLCHGCGHVWRPSDHPTNGVERTASGKDADTRPVDLAAARAEVERLRKDAERWQPIETCPDSFRGEYPNFVLFYNGYHIGAGFCYPSEDGDDGTLYVDETDQIVMPRPTHWMPLPSPPTNAALSAKEPKTENMWDTIGAPHAAKEPT